MCPAYRRVCILAALIAMLGFLPGLLLEDSSGAVQALGYPHFIYPLLQRYPIESHFDHTSPDYTRDDWIRIYTQQDVHRDGACDGADCHCDGTVCTYYDDESPPITDPLWDQDHDDYVCGVGWLWYDGHPGYDLGCDVDTPVYAMQAGTFHWVSDCHVYVDHHNGYETHYRHMDHYDVQDSEEVVLGQQIGLSGDCGANSAHLHYEVQSGGTPVDPWGWEQNLWAGDNPFPSGYRDKDGGIHGPFSLSNVVIRGQWLDRARALGSPVSNVLERSVPNCPQRGGQSTLVATTYEQAFERGSISYCHENGQIYNLVADEYAPTFLPIIWASDQASDWNSAVYIRNLGLGAARVNITFYGRNGWVLDSRTYPGLARNATWEVNVHDVLYDFISRTQYDPVFVGSAVVAADMDVAVMVRTERSNGVMAYAGITQWNQENHETGWGETGTGIYVPTVFWNPAWDNQEWYATIHVQNAGDAEARVSITYYDKDDGQPIGDCAVANDPIPVNGGKDYTPAACVDNGHYEGSAYIHSTNGQCLAVVVTQEDIQNTRTSQYNAFSEGTSGGATALYIPNVMRDWYDWLSSFTVQNLGDIATDVDVDYFGEDGDDFDRCTLKNLPPKASCIVVQDGSVSGPCDVQGDCAVDLPAVGGWEGAAVLVSTNGQPLVAVVNQEHHEYAGEDSRHQSYSAFIWTSNTVRRVLYAPFAAYQYHPTPGPTPTLPPAPAYIYRSASHVQNLEDDTGTTI